MDVWPTNSVWTLCRKVLITRFSFSQKCRKIFRCQSSLIEYQLVGLLLSFGLIRDGN
jgi:hypothetical protein